MTDKTPERIWTTGTAASGSWNNASVSNTRIKLTETEYIRADIHQAVVADNNRLREALKEIDEGSVDISEAAMVARAALETEK